MKPFLIVKTGGTFPEYIGGRGDFEHWTANGMGLSAAEWECVDVQSGEPLPDPSGYAGVVVTGSHDMVTDESPWIGATGQWLVRAAKSGLPLLGICFGHQLMARAFGGEAGDHPGGKEVGVVTISMNDNASSDPLFSRMPTSFAAHVTHTQTALRVPDGSVVLAASSHDAHQAVRFADNAWGVQYHPEFVGDDTRHYLEMQRTALEAQGQDVDAAIADVVETPESAELLPQFVELCRGIF